MNSDLLHEFRMKVNEDYMILHIFRNKNNKNQWSVLCSAMDWIEVALEGIDPVLLSRGNDNKSSIRMITFVSCIDVLWEAIQQAHRVLFDTTEIPFKDDNRIFKRNVSDNIFSKLFVPVLRHIRLIYRMFIQMMSEMSDGLQVGRVVPSLKRTFL